MRAGVLAAAAVHVHVDVLLELVDVGLAGGGGVAVGDEPRDELGLVGREVGVGGAELLYVLREVLLLGETFVGLELRVLLDQLLLDHPLLGRLLVLLEFRLVLLQDLRQ